MPPLSAVLITYNEERDLPQALDSLRGVADEIVVIDSGSTDRTRAIAEQAGARVICHPFRQFDEQRNFGASQAVHEWLLVIDADEVLSGELREALAAWKRNPPERAAYWITRKPKYLGGWIRHSGWYPDSIIRLYRRDRGRYVGALHEAVQTEGPVGRLPGHLLHYTMRSLAEHYTKIDAFTTRAAEDLYARGRRRWRGGMWVGAPWTLVQRFVLQLGFLDGYRGALIAWTSARYVWMKYRKLGVLARGGRLEHRMWPQGEDV
jgi:glycosyltransferase involved in cell wall biosynthesis